MVGGRAELGLEEAGWAVGGSEGEAADWTEAGSGAAGLVAGSVEEDLEAEGLEVDWAAAEM